MVTYGVLFEVRTEFLNNISNSFGFKSNLNSALEEGLFPGAYTSDDTREDPVHRPDEAEGPKNEQTTEKKKIIETATANCYHCHFIVPYCVIIPNVTIFIKKAYGTR
jgi:hypothetical protein